MLCNYSISLDVNWSNLSRLMNLYWCRKPPHCWLKCSGLYLLFSYKCCYTAQLNSRRSPLLLWLSPEMDAASKATGLSIPVSFRFLKQEPTWSLKRLTKSKRLCLFLRYIQLPKPKNLCHTFLPRMNSDELWPLSANSRSPERLWAMR